MAEKDLDIIVDVGGKKNKIMIFMIIFLLILLISLAIWFMLSYLNEKEKALINQQAQDKDTVAYLQQPINQNVSSFEQNPYFSDKMDFTINLAEGQRYLNFSIVVGFSQEESLRIFHSRLPISRDIVISTTQLLTAKELQGGNNIQRFKSLLLKKFNTGMFTVQMKQELNDISPAKKILMEKFILQ